MPKHAVSSPDAPKALGPYTPAVRAGQLLFISGQIPLDPATGTIVGSDIRAQTRRVLDSIGALLTAADLSYEAIVRTTVFLVDLEDFAAMNEVYATYFGDLPPARTTVQAARLPRDVRLEIDVVASYDAR